MLLADPCMLRVRGRNDVQRSSVPEWPRVPAAHAGWRRLVAREFPLPIRARPVDLGGGARLGRPWPWRSLCDLYPDTTGPSPRESSWRIDSRSFVAVATADSIANRYTIAPIAA